VERSAPLCVPLPQPENFIVKILKIASTCDLGFMLPNIDNQHRGLYREAHKETLWITIYD
jgi:hypothetical protein